MRTKMIGGIILLCTCAIAQAATAVTLTHDAANSSGTGTHFQGSPAGLFNDPFIYNPDNPTSTAPVTEVIMNSGNGWHEQTFLDDITLNVDLNHTIDTAERDFAVDIWGITENSQDGNFALHDNNFEVSILGSGGGVISTISGQSIDNAQNNAHHRVLFENLAVNTVIEGIEITFLSPGFDTNTGSVMELRAAAIGPIPEPSSVALISLGSIGLLLRRRK